MTANNPTHPDPYYHGTQANLQPGDLIAPGFQLYRLRLGDLLLVTRFDQPSASTCDLKVLGTVAERNAAFPSLGDPWADTNTPHGRLILTMLRGLAEFERELMRARTRWGRARAKEEGQSPGQKPKLTPHQPREAKARRAAGESSTAIAHRYADHQATISELYT